MSQDPIHTVRILQSRIAALQAAAQFYLANRAGSPLAKNVEDGMNDLDVWVEETDPAVQVVRLSEAAGFSLEETGGGCTALRREDEDGSSILITQIMDPSAPVDPNQPCVVGWYDEQMDQATGKLPQEYPDLQTALDAVAHI